MSLCMLRSTRIGAALRSVATPRPSVSRPRCPSGVQSSKSWSSRFLSTSRLGDSFLAGNNAHYIDEMYLQWKQDPSSVHKSWDVYFRKGEYQAPPNLVADYSASAASSGSPSAPAVSAALSGGVSPQVLEDTSKLIQMIRAFQVRGHFFADIDPLGIEKVRRGYKTPQELELSNYGFTEKDLDRQFPLSFLNTKGFLNNEGQQSMTLREIYTRLKEAYSDKIGVEYMHITDVDQCNWIRERVETRKKIEYTRAQKLELLERMTWADHFERFLAKKFTIKRFGLEGAESMIVALKGMIDRSSQLGVEDVIIGMPHRGRLNVLSSVVKKPMEQILNECSGVYEESEGSGDVKYHLGRSHTRTTYDGKKIHITLLPNPSHLEAVNPVVSGKVRARQHYASDNERRRVMGVLLHGDAAFSGQGVVYETLGMWDLPHYATGGSIHVIVNNQIGFTTDPSDSRSSAYCSELAKAVGSPIFHVNGDDPEAVARVAEISSEWRQRWGKDVFIDLVCYRKHGHNEVDEPMFTQPLMYTKIKQQPSSLEVYTKNLIEKGQVTAEEAKAISDKVNKWLEEKFEASKSFKVDAEKNSGAWGELKGPSVVPATGVSVAKIRELSEKVNTLPADLTPHRNIGRIYEARKKSFVEGKDIDWGGAESMAFATLLAEGSHVRVSGQDAQRGTFSHRHAVVHEQTKFDRPTHTPLAAIAKDRATFEVANSHLSEFAVLGFEYGYATENPTALVIWEAQFGDFVNGAQVIIDQFISCAETKWKRQAGLVMLLPHAYEGAGPEHSSARLERFLQLCDEDPNTFVDTSSPAAQEKQIHGTNYQVVNITSPANLFHALRRQVRRGFRKPLVVMSPKSLLKHRLVKSTIEEFGEGTHFLPVLKETSTNLVPAKQVRRVLFCSGHVYYDLLEHREKKGIKDVAIVRIEQIAPFPFTQVQEAIKQYNKAEIVWVQEEHMNMGAWTYVEPRLETASGHKQRARYVGRPAAASPAAGNHVLHEKELHDFLEAAFE